MKKYFFNPTQPSSGGWDDSPPPAASCASIFGGLMMFFLRLLLFIILICEAFSELFFVCDIILGYDVIILAVRWGWFWGVNTGKAENLFWHNFNYIYPINFILRHNVDITEENHFRDYFENLTIWSHVTFFAFFLLKTADLGNIGHRWGN